MSFRIMCAALCAALAATAISASVGRAQVLDKQRQLEKQSFWDNRDWDWYQEQIPLLDCPDADLETTWYYRWELLTKHLTYGSPNSGYSFTEFIDRPFWSGAYGAISCPAGHQLYEARWLRQPRIARDYSRYWFRTPGAQPRNYSTWLADSVWAVQLVHPDPKFATNLLPDLIANYEAWEKRQFVPEVGLFWQNGHDDGMEFNINSRQTKDILRGAPGYRPSFNAYMWADAKAIARIATAAGDKAVAEKFNAKADGLKRELQSRLWDERRGFFLQMFKNDEERDGHKVKALTRTYDSGQFAGDSHGRELIGYVPWQFNMPDSGRGYEQAWKSLMDRDRFYAPFGPTTVERNDPMFLLQKSCCWWSGQSWPYATTQTLKALANLLQNYDPQTVQPVITKADYYKLLRIYSLSHRKDGRPYLAEACHPDTGSFEGHDGYNHSEHYFHSGFCDLVITGLVGLTPRDDERLELKPLVPESWEYFCLDDVAYRGRRVSIVWDKTGKKYQQGVGLTVLVDGAKLFTRPTLENVVVDLPAKKPKELNASGDAAESRTTPVNFAVNNDGDYYPRVSASHVGPNSSLAKMIDGNYWYHQHPPNRWTTIGSTGGGSSADAASDWVSVDFGVPRRINSVKLYLLDDGERSELTTPKSYEVEYLVDGQWRSIPAQRRTPEQPTGHRANTVRFEPIEITQLRVSLRHADGKRSGLSELEAWGDAELPLPPVPPPAGNLAFNPGDKPFPKASASFTSRFDQVAKANDGKINFQATPNNRWTSYESKSPTDWLEIDFGESKTFSRVELAIYDDRGGVQAPTRYDLEVWTGEAWKPIEDARKSPATPAGGVVNSLSFPAATTTKLRVVFTHKGASRSGLSEIFVWEK